MDMKFFYCLEMKKGMKLQIRQFNRVTVQQYRVPEIHFLMCQMLQVLRSSRRDMLCGNVASIPTEKKVYIL